MGRDVRINSGGVYKWEGGTPTTKVEYTERKNRSGLVLTIALALVGLLAAAAHYVGMF